MASETNSANKSSDQAGLFAKYPALRPVAGVLILLVFVAIAFVLRGQADNVQPNYSSADCYGVDCQPSVTIGGRAVPYGYDNNFSYGTLYAKAGSNIELTWFGNNVDNCKAVKNWTNFTGVYLPPTLLRQPVTKSGTYAVKCYQGKREVIAGALNVVVER